LEGFDEIAVNDSQLTDAGTTRRLAAAAADGTATDDDGTGSEQRF